MPVGGTGSLYSDWETEHPKFGKTKWETFLTEELPSVIDAQFATNGRNVIGGISSGAQGALMLASRTPDLYTGAVGYSGCYLTEGPVGRALTDLVVLNGMANSEMMWGPEGSEAWREHDLFRNASALAGKKIYLSSGNGLPGPHESLNHQGIAQTVIVGGLLEAGSNLCTDQLAQALRDAGVDVTRSAQPVGVHAWPYWRDELGRSWPTIEAALRSTRSTKRSCSQRLRAHGLLRSPYRCRTFDQFTKPEETPQFRQDEPTVRCYSSVRTGNCSC